jgi:hypothetical protein
VDGKAHKGFNRVLNFHREQEIAGTIPAAQTASK